MVARCNQFVHLLFANLPADFLQDAFARRAPITSKGRLMRRMHTRNKKAINVSSTLNIFIPVLESNARI